MTKSNMNSTKINPQTLIKEIKQLVSLPGVCIKINEMVDDDSCSASDIGKVIASDVNLSVRLLKIANSSFYGFPSKIETIPRAITVIGDTELRALVLATAAIEAFDNIPLDSASMNGFWKHSLQCAIISRLIASKMISAQSEQLFVTGLLHDIGHLIMFQKCPEQEQKVLINAALHNRDVYLEEVSVFGFDHAYLGGELLQEWGLPPGLIEPVKFHHQPGLAENFKIETAIVHIANILAKNAQLDTYAVPYEQLLFDDKACELVNFSEQVFDDVIKELPAQYSSAVALFLPESAAA